MFGSTPVKHLLFFDNAYANIESVTIVVSNKNEVKNMEKNIIRCMDSIARKAIKSITMIMAVASVVILGMTVNAKAETNSNIAFYLAMQPANVQAHIAKQGVNISVVNELPWTSSDLAITYAYTTMHGTQDVITGIDIVIKSGYESALTHEVGHCISNLGNIRYYYATTPEFQAICAAECRNSLYVSSQGWDNPIEYFACAYDAYINFPQALKKYHPLTYNYIQAVVAQTN